MVRLLHYLFRSWLCLIPVVAGIASAPQGAEAVELPTPGVLVADQKIPTNLSFDHSSENLTPLSPKIINKIKLIKPGKKVVYGFAVSEPLFEAQAAINNGLLNSGLDLLDQADGEAKSPFELLYNDLYRIHALNLYGRMSEAELLLDDFTKQEIAFHESNVMAITLLADTQSRLGETTKAIRNYQTVIASLKGWRFPTSYSRPPSNIDELTWIAETRARATLGLALAYFFEGDYSTSKHWALQCANHTGDVMRVLAHMFYGRFLGRAHPDILLSHAVALTLLGAAQIHEGASRTSGNQSLDYARKAFDRIGFSHGEAHIAVMSAKALVDAGNHRDALLVANEALKLSRAAGLHDFIWRVEYLKGLALLSAGDKDSAEEAFRYAQIAVDEQTGLLGGDTEKRRFGIGKRDITYQLTRLTFDRQEAALLFTDLERGRARAFVDMLANVVEFGGTSSEAVKELRRLDLKSRQQFHVNQLRRNNDAFISDQSLDVLSNSASLTNITTQRNLQLKNIRERNSDLASLLAVSVEELDSLRQQLPEGTVLSYFLPTRRAEPVRRINISSVDVEFEELDLTGVMLGDFLMDLEDAIDEQDIDGQVASLEKIGKEMRLSSWTRARNVYVVPSDLIYHVPWGALEINKPVMVLPTASWLLMTDSRPVAGRSVVVGDPDFGGALPQLPGAVEEATFVASILETTALLGSKATKSALRKSIGPGVDILHLATHGQFDSRYPLRSSVFLSGPGGYEKLTAMELFENPLAARVVILSACESGVGEVATGDDFLGLQRSFYLGGASTVVSSLWTVDDRGTAEFMKHFYQALEAGQRYGEAWLTARNTLKNSGLPPWVYGAFIVGGRQ